MFTYMLRLIVVYQVACRDSLQVNLFQRWSKYFALGESKYVQLFEGPTTSNGAILGIHFFHDKSDFTPGYLCLAGSHYGLLDWTSPKWCKMPFPVFFSANHVYSAYLFAKFVPLASWANVTGAGRGQMSRACLSFNEKIRSIVLQTLAFVEAYLGNVLISLLLIVEAY